MADINPVRWGILGTARIAQTSFLPGLRAAGGQTYAIAGRDAERTRQYAEENGIEHAITGYQTLLDDDRVEAVYIPLPNSMHAEWIIKSLQAGKAVLCEKPLCVTVQETEQVLEVARRCSQPLWEAFVFPFRRQTARLQELLQSGTIGEVREVQSTFTFSLRSRDNIRLQPHLGGGALYDVGCYNISLAALVLGRIIESGIALARWAPEGVDEAMEGVLNFQGERRLVFSCGMDSRPDTFSRILGTEGEIRLTNPWHPNENDTLEIRNGDGIEVEHPNGPEPSFAPALTHIQEVIRGEAKPQHLAIDEALPNAQAIDLLLTSARSGRRERLVEPARE